LVVDANVWIDLYHGDLIAELFRLPYQFVSPNVIIFELETFDAQILANHGLIQVNLESEAYSLLSELQERYSGPGVNDLTALVVALQEGIALLTGDGKLREAAEVEGVESFGVLWLLDRLIDHNILDTPEAADALEVMLQNGARLPQSECAQRLKRWRG